MSGITPSELRPLKLGELLDRAIRLYKQNFVKFVGIIGIVQVPIIFFQLVSSLISSSEIDQLGNPALFEPDNLLAMYPSSYFIGLGLSLLTSFLSFLLVSGVGTAAMTKSIASHYLGEESGILDSYRNIGRSWISLVGALFIASLFVLALILFAIIPCIGWLTGTGGAIYFATVLIPLIAPIVILERKPAGESILRAWNLARQRFWWLLGFAFILFLFTQLVVGAPTLLITFLSQTMLPDAITSGTASTLLSIQSIIQALISLVFSLLYVPFQLTCITLVYFDLRVRYEGLDLVVLSHEVAGEKVSAEEIPLRTPQSVGGAILSWNEVGYFAILSIGISALVALLYGVIFLLAFAAIGLGGGF